MLALTIGLSSALHPSGLAFLGVILWLLALGSVAVAAYLVVVYSRPIAAVGALLSGIAILIAFLAAPQPWLLWTTLFFVGVYLWIGCLEESKPDSRRLSARGIVEGCGEFITAVAEALTGVRNGGQVPA